METKQPHKTKENQMKTKMEILNEKLDAAIARFKKETDEYEIDKAKFQVNEVIKEITKLKEWQANI